MTEVKSFEQNFFTNDIKSIFPEGENYFLTFMTALPLGFVFSSEFAEEIKFIIRANVEEVLERNIQIIIFLHEQEPKNNHSICKIDVLLNTSSPITKKEANSIKNCINMEKKIKFCECQKVSLNNFDDSTSNIIVPDLPNIIVPGWKNLNFDDRLLTDDNYLRNESPFKRFFGVDSQIRMVLSALQSAIQTGGKRMVHSVLFGPPACGKTSVVNMIEELIGKQNVLKLDAPTTTKAGIEKLFLNTDIPPVVILEEAEKANEDWLRNWLSLLDERSEIRKVNHKETIVKDIDILFYCTVNDSDKFNNLLDGALASRCKNKIYFPRPSMETIEKILYRDIKENGGRNEWVQHALQLAKDLNIDDPRVIISFLSGGDRLLDGSYQQDKKKCINTNLIT